MFNKTGPANAVTTTAADSHDKQLFTKSRNTMDTSTEASHQPPTTSTLFNKHNSTSKLINYGNHPYATIGHQEALRI